MIKKILSVLHKWACKDNNNILIFAVAWLIIGSVFSLSVVTLMGFAAFFIHMLGEVMITAASKVNPTYEVVCNELDGGEVKFTVKKKGA